MRGAARLALALATLGWLAACAGSGAPAADRPFNHVFDCNSANSVDDPRCEPFLRN
jgi:hypothetical protein